MTQNPLLNRSRGASKGDVPQGRAPRALRPKHKKAALHEYGVRLHLWGQLFSKTSSYTQKSESCTAMGTRQKKKALAAPSLFIRKKPLGLVLISKRISS